MPIELGFEGRTALVTGAATGIGFAIAEAFGRAGARVAVNDLSPERCDRACERLASGGIRCDGYPADVRDPAAVRRMVDKVGEGFGGPDVLVANAGIYPNTPFLDLSAEEWDRVIDTNLTGVFLTCQAAARAMVAAGHGGRIVTVGSGAANTAYWGWSHYCASKAAVVMLTKAMSLELGGHGIRANTVLAGHLRRRRGRATPRPGLQEPGALGRPSRRAGRPLVRFAAGRLRDRGHARRGRRGERGPTGAPRGGVTLGRGQAR